MTDSRLTKLWREYRKTIRGSKEEFRVLEALSAELGLDGERKTTVKQTETASGSRETSKSV